MSIISSWNIFNKRITQAGILQFAAVVVAAPRYMGMFPYSMGTLITERAGWFMAVESYSGLAMAVLEGWAIAYTSGRLRVIKSPKHKRIVQNLIILQLALLPLTLAPFMMGAELGQLSTELLPLPVAWFWKFLVAAISPIIVFTVGYVDVPADIARKTKDKPPAIIARKTKDKNGQPANGAGRISARQMLVEKMVAEGKTNEQIATACGVSIGTVKNDKRAIRESKR